MKVYIAGPFFNAAQVDLIERLEQWLQAARIEYYSPRHHSDNKPGTITNEMAKRIFMSNVTAIAGCDKLLAVLDWKLPQGQGLYALQDVELNGWSVLESAKQGLTPVSGLGRGPLSLPDTGTVFEMGYAYRMGMDIIGYTEQGQNAKLNIMLTQCCEGVMCGKPDFDYWVTTGTVPAWTGRNL